MKVVGIVAEYNPLHNGHLFQINKIRRMLNPDLIVAVISGDFTQRGEPALLSKWQRTRLALLAGADLVIELPYVFAVGRADIFAGGAVSILNHLKVSHLVFGSEAGKIEPFTNGIEAIENHSDLYRQTVSKALKSGISYPNAHAAAYRSVTGKKNPDFVDLSQPNNSLGFHYIQAIRRKGADIRPITFKREQAGHNDSSLETDAQIASGSAIRSLLLSGADDIGRLENKLPGFSYSLLKKQRAQNLLVDWEKFFPFLKYRMLSSTSKQLANVYEAEEGIENRLLKMIRQSDSFEQFIRLLKTKRYTWVRLQRLCAHVLTHTLKEEAKEQAAGQEAACLRLLGMSRNGQAYLSGMRRQLQIPLIAKIRRHHPPELDPDLRAAQIYDYLSGRDPSEETAHAPIRLINGDDSSDN